MNELNYLKQQLELLIENRTIKITTGNLSDYAVYRQVVGELRGIALAIDEINAMQRKMNEADNV